MSLKLECPNCGQLAFVPDEAINRRARCTGCHATYAVQEALLSNNRPSLREKLTLGLGLGIPAIVFLVFVTYWFGYRDTWEIDNFTLINEHCDAVLHAVRTGEDWETSETALINLNKLIGERTIKDKSLVALLEQTRNEYAPVGEQLEQARRERLALEQAKLQEQKEHEEAERRRLAQNDRDSFYNPDRNPPYLVNYIEGSQSRSGAITALAVGFNKDSRWVEANMGPSNDLSDIYRNLVRALFQEAGLWP